MCAVRRAELGARAVLDMNTRYTRAHRGTEYTRLVSYRGPEAQVQV